MGVYSSERAFLIPIKQHSQNSATAGRTLFYGWVIVVACMGIMAMHTGLMYTYGIFFKHLTADFGWSRGATSGVHSVFMITHGLFATGMGWLVDRFGPAKIMTFCAFIAGLGLVLTSQIQALWQLYIAYGVIFGIGASGGFITTMATTARWFVKRRGLALGIVASGAGLGTLLLAPISERLIDSFGWSLAYIVLGAAAWTYVAGAVSAIGTLFYYVLVATSGSRQRR